MNERQRAAAYVALAATLAVVTVALTITRPAALWLSMRPATCLPGDCFTEAVHSGPVRQPIAAWTSLIFVLLSLWALGSERLFEKRTAESRIELRWRLLFGFSMLVTGLGSFFYHASLTYFGQATDVLGMYLTVIAICLVRRFSLTPVSSASFYAAFIASVGVTAAIQIFLPDVRRFIFFALVIAVIWNEIALQKSGSKFPAKDFVCAIAVLATAFSFWLVDRYRLVGNPDGLIQGHSMWHLLSAVAALFVHRFMVLGIRGQGSIAAGKVPETI